MKKLILLFAITLSFTSCSTDEGADQFCGEVVGRGHQGSSDFIAIHNGSEQRNFKVENYMSYPMHSYQCK